MNESIVHHAARAVKLISESLGVPSVAEENERLYAEDEFRFYRVPVTLTRDGFVTVHSRNATSAGQAIDGPPFAHPTEFAYSS